MRVEGEWPTSVMHNRGEGSSTGRRARLPLVLRMALLQRRGARPASLGEQGYALAVALAAAFVLLLGVGALASRGNLGFIGQVFQTQNRRARDVAENAIREFVDVINREENRHLMIAGTTDNWGTDEFRNICTAVNSSGIVVETSPGNPDYDDATGYNDFLPVGVNPAANDWKSRGTGKSFVVERIDFLPEIRDGDQFSPNPLLTSPNANNTYSGAGETGYYLNADGSSKIETRRPQNRPPSDLSYLEMFRAGNRRALIRVTVIGRVNENGRISTSRLARELEVVPKCCNRSFGTTLGGQNWGRDTRRCPTGTPADYGIIAGMNGGVAAGSNNSKPIITESNVLLSEAGCWAGNSGGTTELTANPNTTCTSNQSSVGTISFNPIQLDYVQPPFDHPIDDATVGDAVINVVATAVPVTGVTNGIIYFDPTRLTGDLDGDGATQDEPGANSGLVYSRDAGSPTRLDGQALDSTASADPCYTDVLYDSAGEPYYNVKCSITSLAPQGNTKIYVDTSAAQVNIFFQGNGTYGIGTGSSGVYRLHNYVTTCTTGTTCSRASLASPPPASFPTQDTLYSAAWVDRFTVKWTSVAPGTEITQADQRLNNYLELCGDRSPGFANPCDENRYAIRRLLNFYASGTGTFNVYGNGSGLAYNIYAPRANVVMNGGGNTEQFMGQIWTNNLTINGNIQISTFSGYGEDGTYNGIQLIDFLARSFSQSSGF